MFTTSHTPGAVPGPLDISGNQTARALILRPGHFLLISSPWPSIPPFRPAKTWQTKRHGATYSQSLPQSVYR